MHTVADLKTSTACMLLNNCCMSVPCTHGSAAPVAHSDWHVNLHSSGQHAYHVAAGYLFTYYNSKVGKEREAQIDRVNEQVKDLYGPLLSCVTASKSAFDSMIQQHSPDGTRETFVSAIRASPDSREAQIYR